MVMIPRAFEWTVSFSPKTNSWIVLGTDFITNSIELNKEFRTLSEALKHIEANEEYTSCTKSYFDTEPLKTID